MKLASIELNDFKRFTHQTFDLWDAAEGEPLWRVLFVGDNGAGKTTVLQAAALCLSLATGKTSSVDDFSWPGWLAERHERWGTPQITLDVCFEPREIEATQQVFKAWRDSRIYTDEIEPSQHERVRLILKGRELVGEPAELAQFRARDQARRLLRHQPQLRGLFKDLPGVFWFDQFRNLGAMPADPDLARDATNRGSPGIGTLREYLVKMWHGREQGKAHRTDFLGQLERLFQTAFPDRRFADCEPRYVSGLPTPDDYYFMLADGERTYDLEEMSAGEQAIFPLFYDFVRQQIGQSVVLIDEIDLNLHPPLAQTLLQMLPSLGSGCQYLMTTHSSAVSDLMADLEIRRLPGGRPCL